jgi:hypothetical protein
MGLALARNVYPGALVEPFEAQGPGSGEIDAFSARVCSPC